MPVLIFFVVFCVLIIGSFILMRFAYLNELNSGVSWDAAVEDEDYEELGFGDWDD